MRIPFAGAALAAALGLTAACSSPSPAAQPTQVARTAPAPRQAQPRMAPTGRSAIVQHDTPYAQVLAQARSSGRPTVLYFWTSWWGFCQRLDREALMDPRVGGEMQNFVAVRYDADRGEGKAIARQYGVDAYPTFVILDRNGRKIDSFAAYRPPNEMIARLKRYRGG